MNLDNARLEETRRIVRNAWTKWTPSAALVLGSGWGAVTDSFEVEDEIPYERLPALGATEVQGHAGRLVRARSAGVETLIFVGRRHAYEGRGWTPVVAPAHLAKHLGVRHLLLTNAAGGANPKFQPGDLMIVTDHLNLFFNSPLAGPHDPFWGERFPDMTAVYDAELRMRLERAGKAAGVELRQGVYAGVPGPAYETPAEVRMYQRLGADAIGMSTVPEAVVAHAAGIEVAALSCITNMAAGLGGGALSHAEVAAVAAGVMTRMRGVITAFWAQLAELEAGHPAEGTSEN